MNRLAHESSPYLQQHADNPVDWYPWGAEAFEIARRTNRPICLSVGYSACHWCHVMAHESFEDETTAKVMNELFVNVKVDREERPDVDAVYMEAVQAVSGQGGWPMTVFLTPDARPFFAGTYFAKEAFAGRPAFVDVLHAVDAAWRDQREELNAHADALQQAIVERTQPAPSGDADVFADGTRWLSNATNALINAHDKEWGGFGEAPKFPQPTALELLLRSDDPRAIDVVKNTLDAMASGGIYDHLGGGFHRYSVDAFWMVPHFEKMLYDQSALGRVYTLAYLATGDDRYAQIANETIEYVLRDLRSDGGAFFAAEDADSEGEEGRFYVWRPEAIDTALNDDELSAQVKGWYGVTQSGNFEGSNILHRPQRGAWPRSTEISAARATLLATRSTRVRPGLDDKVLTEWNAMFIATLAESAVAMKRSDWLDAAVTAADFLLNNLRDANGRWLRSWHKTSGPKQLAYANDYAWLIVAFTHLGEATGKARWRALATETADAMLDLFWDADQGGLFTVGRDSEQLIVKTKDLFDGAIASANSTAAVALSRLAALDENATFAKRATTIVNALALQLENHPTAFTNLLVAVDTLVKDSTETVIAGDHPELVATVHQSYLPRNVLLWGERDQSPLWQERSDGAFVCRQQTCAPPTTDAATLTRELTRNVTNK